MSLRALKAKLDPQNEDLITIVKNEEPQRRGKEIAYAVNQRAQKEAIKPCSQGIGVCSPKAEIYQNIEEFLTKNEPSVRAYQGAEGRNEEPRGKPRGIFVG
jgi:hypothetical protein